MSVSHLAQGSVETPRVDGLLRVYSMVFCPYAKRARLVVKVKNLPHDIVNINLQSKPDWYLKIHPKGQVPSLLDGDKIVIESLDIADYLDEKYPTDSPLYPSDPAAKKRDQEVIRNRIGEALASFGKVVHGTETYTVEQALDILLPAVQPLEDELSKRGTPFFGGDKPGMIDFMLWPWVELIPFLPVKLGVEKLPLKDEHIPSLRKWAKTMLEVPVVKELVLPPELVIEIAEARKNNTLDYDVISKKSLANAQ